MKTRPTTAAELRFVRQHPLYLELQQNVKNTRGQLTEQTLDAIKAEWSEVIAKAMAEYQEQPATPNEPHHYVHTLPSGMTYTGD